MGLVVLVTLAGNCYYQYVNGKMVRVADLGTLSAGLTYNGDAPFQGGGFSFDISLPFKFNSVSPAMEEEKLEF